MELYFDLVGNWGWVFFALILFGVEVIAPSTFLLWPAISALVVGIVSLLLGQGNPIWPWQAQVVVFLLLSVVVAWVGRGYLRSRKLDESDKPMLNERGAQLIGQTSTLTVAIEDGRGRAKFGDSSWTVAGPNAGAGRKVRVVGVKGSVLEVELI